MYYNILKSALRLIAQLNEFTLIFSIWIISPTTTSEGRTRSSLLGSILRSTCYGISEPLYAYPLARLPIDPAFTLLMTTVFHGFQIFWLWITLDCVANFRLHNAQKKEQTLQAKAAHARETLTLEESSDAGDCCPSRRDLDWKVLYPLVFSCIQTAAASNAALLLAAQNMDVIVSKSHTVHVILLTAGVFYFFLSRLADCYLAWAMSLPLYFGQHRAATMMVQQLANLVLVILLRFGSRWVLGMDVFAGAWGNDAQGVEKFVGFGRFLHWLGHAPKWLSPCLLVLSPCLMYLSGRFSAKARIE